MIKILKVIAGIAGVLLITTIINRSELLNLPFNNNQFPISSSHANSVPFPRHGHINYSFSNEAVAPFEIISPKNDQYYYLLLQNANNDDFIQIYIHGGMPFETLVPIGDYHLSWSTGNVWLGDNDMFGLMNPNFKATEKLSFSIEDWLISGVIFSFDVIFGNVHSTHVNPDELVMR